MSTAICKSTAAAAALAAALLAAPAFADVVELKTGQRVEGALKQATPASVSIEVGGQTITFEGDKVRAIYFGAGPAPSPVATPVITPDHRDSALQALAGLRAITKSGVAYRDYNLRLHDATIAVDRYLRAAPPSDDRDVFSVAMGFYSLAATAWSARLSRGTVRGADYPFIERCARAKEFVDHATPPERGTFGGTAYLSDAVHIFWACGADLPEARRIGARSVERPS